MKFTSSARGVLAPRGEPFNARCEIIVGSPERRLQSGAGVAPRLAEAD